MNFQPHLARLVMAGDKTVTRRRMSLNPNSPWHFDGPTSREGRDEAVTQGRGRGPAIGRIMVTNVAAVRLGDIDEDEAVREGFKTVEEFEAAWMNINGGWNPDELVWRIEFKVHSEVANVG